MKGPAYCLCRLGLIVAILVGASACQTTEPAVQEKLTTDAYVAQKRWVRPGPYSLSLCENTPTGNKTDNCRVVKDGRFLVLRAIGQGDADAYEIKFDNGKTGFVTSLATTDNEEQHSERVRKKAECDRRGNAAVGMTREQVYASCWGRPYTVNTTIGPSYSRNEQFVYGPDQSLNLENGIVRSIQAPR
jgi:hypothetical protein